MTGYNLKGKCPFCNVETNCKNQLLSGVGNFICPNCRKNVVVISTLSEYEIYFHAAIEQFIEENYAESVFLLAKSRESFIEYIIRLIFYKKNKCIDFDFGKAKMKFSERKLGMLSALYFSEFNEYLNLYDGSVNIRNDDVHSKEYPKKEDVIKLGNDIINLFNEIIQKILDNYEPLILTEYHASTQREKINPHAEKNICFNISNVIAWLKGNKIKSFEELVTFF